MIKSAINTRRDLLGNIAPRRTRREFLGDEIATALPSTVNAETLANLVGLTPRMVYELSRREIVIRTGHGEYALKESVRNYIKSIHKRSNSDKLTAERIRQTKEQADQLAFKNARAKGELLAASEVEEEWVSILRDLRAALLALPARIQLRVSTLTLHDVAAIDSEIRNLLTELGTENADRNT